MVIKGLVTRNDISLGIPRNGRLCPLGRAIDRILFEAGILAEVRVLDVVKISFGPLVFVSDPPLDLARFIDRFDNGFSVAPIQFKLEFEEIKNGRSSNLENKSRGLGSTAPSDNGEKDEKPGQNSQHSAGTGKDMETNQGQSTRPQGRFYLSDSRPFLCGLEK